MSDKITIENGTRLQVALPKAAGTPDFNLISTFAKAVDDSYFLMSIPMKDGKSVEISDSQRVMLRYTSQEIPMIMTAYCDDIVKEGMRKYWKMRRVSEQRQFFQRADERYKVALHIEYMQDTWPLNFDGYIEKEEALTLDISAGGVAAFIPTHFDVGEIVKLTFPRIGTTVEGRERSDVVAVVCWLREAPKGSPYKNVAGFQFRFSGTEDRADIQSYVSNVKTSYKL